MSEATSPRLPGVPLLLPHATGPEYSRWRRSIKFALQTRDLWRYCNGKCPMPMPEAGPNAFPPSASTTNVQPSLLEERRAWVRQDREVKLDVFLSLTEEVMQEVFEVGPPLPPSNLNAQGMIQALDKHYAVFKFEAYHHAFCHFLNLHVDQFASIQEFNQEFSAVLEDLVDHGQPLSNLQACSAYFSKLRCTQNPWVAKKLEDWDSQPEDAGIMDLMKESPAWAVIRPLNTKSSQNFHVESIPEEHLEDTDGQESDSVYGSTTGSTVSSIVSHSRQPSVESVRQTKTPPNDLAQKHLSNSTAHSLEITVHASSDEINEIDPRAFRKAEQLPLFVIPERGSSKHQTPFGFGDEGDVPEWLSARKSIARRPPPPPHNRPLPPLPAHAKPAKQDDPRPRSASPRVPVNTGEDMPKPNLVSSQSADKVTTRLAGSRPPPLRLETTHPTLRPFAPARTPLGFRTTTPAQLLTADLPLHPALRPQTASPAPSTRPATAEPDVPVTTHKRSHSAESVAIPWPSTPDVAERPQSSRAILGSPPEQETADEPAEVVEQAKRVVSQLPSPPMVRTEVPTTPFLDSTLQRWVYSPASMSCPSLPYSPSLYDADDSRISTIEQITATGSIPEPSAPIQDSPTLSTMIPNDPLRLSTQSASAPELAPHSPEPPIPAAIEYDANPPLQLQLTRTHSTSSDLSLPLQGTPTTPTSTASADAWTYLYESKGGYLLPATATPRVPTPSPPLHQAPFRRTPMVEDAVVSLSTSLHHRSVDSIAGESRDGGRLAQRLKASSLDLVARLGGDSVFETSESARERERRERKRRGWSMGVVGGLARGVKGRGVKEII